MSDQDPRRCTFCSRSIPSDSKSTYVDDAHQTYFCNRDHFNKQTARDVIVKLSDEGRIDQHTVSGLLEDLSP